MRELEYLRYRWSTLWGAFQVPFLSQTGEFEILRALYDGPGRFYHGISHIADLLLMFEKIRRFAKDRSAVEAAIFFHDVVYDTHASDNEEKSAAYARRVLGDFGMSDRFADRVAQLIMTTKHNRTLTDPDEQLIADMDLSGFGQEYSVVEASSRKIRQEYAWVPRQEYIAGRTKILEMFRAREPLYFTPHFRSKYEAAAKANLEREIANLEALSALP